MSVDLTREILVKQWELKPYWSGFNEKGGIREITQPIFSRNFAPKEEGQVAKGACMIENFFLTQRLQ